MQGGIDGWAFAKVEKITRRERPPHPGSTNATYDLIFSRLRHFSPSNLKEKIALFSCRINGRQKAFGRVTAYPWKLRRGIVGNSETEFEPPCRDYRPDEKSAVHTSGKWRLRPGGGRSAASQLECCSLTHISCGSCEGPLECVWQQPPPFFCRMNLRRKAVAAATRTPKSESLTAAK